LNPSEIGRARRGRGLVARGLPAMLLALGLVAPAEAQIPADTARAELLPRIAAGTATPADVAALRDAFESQAALPGPVSAFEARRLMSDAVAAAASSGSDALLDAISAVLEVYAAEDLGEHRGFARDQLGQKVRCAASARGDAARLEHIARVLGDDLPESRTDGTVGDRQGLHARADLFRVAARGERVAVAGYLGALLVSSDGGTTWSAPATGTDEPLFDVALGPGDEIWAVGRDGVVLHSADAGARFERRPTPFRRHLFGVVAPAPGSALVAGDFGLQLRTDDSGARWTCLPRDADLILSAVRPAAKDAVFAGEFGTLERLQGLSLPGRRGVLEGVPEDVAIHDVWFREDGQVGLAVGIAGTLLRTEDGGATWAPPPGVRFDVDLYGVSGAGDAVVVAGDGGLVARSTDGGRSFARAEVPAIPAPLLGVAFASPTRAFVVGPRGLVLRSDDAGARFVPVHGPGAAR